MRSVLKFFVISVGMALILIGVIALLLATQVEKYAKTVVEEGLGYVYRSEVTLERVSLDVREQAIELHNLAVANPEGFDAEKPAMTIDRVRASVQLHSLMADKPVVNEVVLDGTVVNLHYKPGRGTNLGALYDSAARLKKAADEGPAGVRQRFVIEKFESKGATLNASTSLIPIGVSAIEIDPFTLTDLGEDDTLTAATTSMVFIRSLFKEGLSVSGVVGSLAERLQEEFNELSDDEKPE